ncbi:hypothetical protein GeomeDRAFT_1049 [Geobacter metallireducens RCH3]|nr:hypothetical protein GeomeDRAFT_1049 [Geobacter metallireducens RCH3]
MLRRIDDVTGTVSRGTVAIGARVLPDPVRAHQLIVAVAAHVEIGGALCFVAVPSASHAGAVGLGAVGAAAPVARIALDGARIGPARYRERCTAATIAVTVEIGAGSVAGRVLARQIAGIGEDSAVRAAAVGRFGELYDERALGDARGVGKGTRLGGVVRVARGATPRPGSQVVAVFLAGTRDRRVVSVAWRRAMAGGTAGRGSKGRRAPNRGRRLEVAVDVRAASGGGSCALGG